MNSGSDLLHEYCEQYTSPQSKRLAAIERATHLETTQPRMLSGHLQGRFLALLSKLQQPELILEVGTFTGYASLCLAEGLSASGELHTLEVNPELQSKVEKNWNGASKRNQMHLHIVDAKEFIQQQDGPWDLVFLDAAKKEYPQYFDLLHDKVPSGGLIIADNVLWSGKVVDTDAKDASTEALRTYARKVQNHPDWENVMVPLRDGLLIARKR